jgi:natural product precursor
MSKRLSLVELSKNEMEKVKGGYIITEWGDGHSCGCGCYYANSGGSSTVDNCNWNIQDELWSP